MKKLGYAVGLVAVLVAVLVAGCKEKGRGSAASPGPVLSRPEANLPVELPETWKPGPESAVRSASYVVQGDGGAVADVSLVILAGQPGGLLRNVNSWRTQLDQPSLDAASFEQSVKWITTPVGEGAVIDIAGPADEASAAFDGRMLAVVVERPTHSWIFQMRGNAGLVEAQRGAFLEWVGGVRPAGEGAQVASTPPEPEPAVPAKLPAAGERPAWSVPDGWREAPASDGASARFTVSGPGDQAGAVTVFLLEGDGGGALANVNRWRQEAGLAAIAQQDLAGRFQSIFVGGTRMSIIRLAGPNGSITAAWVTRGEGTWLFKLTGPAGVVDAERGRFAMFLRTVSFPEN